jgi:membrane-associated phospholipid phosphatase
MNLLIIFDYIGHYGPLLLFIITFYSLLHRNIYLFVYLFGSIANLLFNIFLKHIFREPRPNNPIEFIDSNELNGNNYYGLPSGHAQSSLFSLAFLYFVNGSISTLYTMGCITVLTLYQRWKYRRHTIKQLIIGSFIGALFAWILFFITKNYLYNYKQHFYII